MVIALGADHAGFGLKEHLKRWLTARGHTVLDFGPHDSDPVDYPDYAAPVAQAVMAGRAERGVLVCGSGIGMAMVANRVPGVRAAACADVETARLSREHNDANVLTLGARITPAATAVSIVETWLATPFAGGRHSRRLEKFALIERAYGRRAGAHAPTE